VAVGTVCATGVSRILYPAPSKSTASRGGLHASPPPYPCRYGIAIGRGDRSIPIFLSLVGDLVGLSTRSRTPTAITSALLGVDRPVTGKQRAVPRSISPVFGLRYVRPPGPGRPTSVMPRNQRTLKATSVVSRNPALPRRAGAVSAGDRAHMLVTCIGRGSASSSRSRAGGWGVLSHHLHGCPRGGGFLRGRERRRRLPACSARLNRFLSTTSGESNVRCSSVPLNYYRNIDRNWGRLRLSQARRLRSRRAIRRRPNMGRVSSTDHLVANLKRLRSPLEEKKRLRNIRCSRRGQRAQQRLPDPTR